MLALRLDEVAYPDYEPHEDYVPDECFYCHRTGNPQCGYPRAVEP